MYCERCIISYSGSGSSVDNSTTVCGNDGSLYTLDRGTEVRGGGIFDLKVCTNKTASCRIKKIRFVSK